MKLLNWLNWPKTLPFFKDTQKSSQAYRLGLKNAHATKPLYRFGEGQGIFDIIKKRFSRSKNSKILSNHPKIETFFFQK